YSSISSGSSIIRMLQDSPDSPNSVMPGTTSSSTSSLYRTAKNEMLEGEPQRTPPENTPVEHRLDEAPDSDIQEISATEGANTADSNPVQALPGITTLINDNIWVSKVKI
ncbi:MAG: hypothetical protein MJE68_06250, partial [Proteobacteria bacterium]|nr:hypothetical protein [Pseudomonadota bacterium]